jgi:hypothetical protein
MSMQGSDPKPGVPLLDRIFLFCGLLMLVDLAFFGSGLLLPGIGLSVRRMLFVIILLVAALRRLLARKPFTRTEVALLLLMLVLVGLWTLALPASYGYSLGIALGDVSPWLGLALLAVWPWDAWPLESQWYRFRRFFVALAVTLALIHLGIWASLVTNVTSPGLLVAATSLLPTNAGEDSVFFSISALSSGSYRIYWSSSIFLMGGLYFLVAYRPARVTFSWALALALVCAALFVTYIRSFLAAGALFCVLPWLFKLRSERGAALNAKVTVLAMWIVGVALVCIAIDPSVLEALQLSRDVSDTERIDQASALLGQFATHPVLGTGFGSYVTQHVRLGELPSAYELVFHALLMKVGVVGMILLVAILALSLDIAGIASRARVNPRRFASWVAFTTGFWFAGATNPIVTNFIGMAIIVLLLVDMRHWGVQAGVAGA